MIKFKEFNVGDADYKEQMEQFQTEHQNAEFVQITGGHMSYEKIWFKYEPSDISDSTDKLSVEKLQEQLNTAKKALTGAIKDIEQFHEFAEKSLSKNYPHAFKSDSRFDYTRSAVNVLTDALAAIGKEGSGDESC